VMLGLSTWHHSFFVVVYQPRLPDAVK